VASGSAKQPIKLIVALGNPGREHQSDRHNIGFRWLDQLCEREQSSLKAESKFSSKLAKLNIAGQSVFCMAPQTFMNASGRAVSAVAKFYKIDPAEILVVYDELDLPPGAARLKFSGGHGGHNGVRDIAKALSSKDFWRLRIGIGHPGSARDVSDYVLSSSSVSDAQKIQAAVDDSFRVLGNLIAGESDQAMLDLHTEIK
jgi:peptidyl-tRNA hydrolase, PTH1 family